MHATSFTANQHTTVRPAVVGYYRALSANDTEAWVRLFARDATCLHPVEAAPLGGHDELRSFFRGLWSVFSRLDIRAKEIVITGSIAAAKWSALGKAGNGRTVRFGGLDVFEFGDDGAIRGLRSYWKPQSVRDALYDSDADAS